MIRAFLGDRRFPAKEEFRVQSLFEPNTANRPRKPYKPLLASNPAKEEGLKPPAKEEGFNPFPAFEK